ncbi:MAG: DNA-binding response regulator [Sphingomonas sp. SCN 67-18]|uniref:response regulator n=1 Tax=uncultured Sphingomonas sp. TaxID=158754 RepID=UPI00086B3EC1|nr:response regulator transcription factor [Sphingomonas sp. SCN 67-18]ODU20002.1 MAG: DNA-binding response regulator [Sphingomonas sp. SCN 67-18]
MAKRRDGALVERVLIADDHALVRDGLRTVLAVAFDACELFEASSIDEVIATIEREADFDLVLLDLNMPGSKGLSGLAQLRDRYPSIPVVIVSGSSERGLVRSAIEGGASGFVSKSMKRSAIVDALRLVLAGEVFVPEQFEEASEESEEEADIGHRIDTLTPQQKVVLQLLVAGRLNKQIAYELDVSMTTVKAHVSAILAKLKVFSRTQAVILANKINYPGGAGTPPRR